MPYRKCSLNLRKLEAKGNAQAQLLAGLISSFFQWRFTLKVTLLTSTYMVYFAIIFITSFFRTPCKINPAANSVLSARKPCKEETPLKRLQDQQQQHKEAEAGNLQEQSMYCKELLLSGATEFCFEELRAERHFKKIAQELQKAGREESQAN